MFLFFFNLILFKKNMHTQRCMFSMDPSNGSQYRVFKQFLLILLISPINLLPLCTFFWERFDYAYILLTPLLKRCTCFFWRNILPKMCLNTCFLANAPLAEIHNKKLVDKSLCTLIFLILLYLVIILLQYITIYDFRIE